MLCGFDDGSLRIFSDFNREVNAIRNSIGVNRPERKLEGNWIGKCMARVNLVIKDYVSVIKKDLLGNIWIAGGD